MGKAVLVVEDNEDNLLIVGTILRHYGYDVLSAPDGETALSLVGTARPQLVLLDISLPMIDGWAVARAMKADPELADIPIVAFTAHAYEADRDRANLQGFVGFLTKPIEPLKIVEEVKRLIGPA